MNIIPTKMVPMSTGPKSQSLESQMRLRRLHVSGNVGMEVVKQIANRSLGLSEDFPSIKADCNWGSHVVNNNLPMPVNIHGCLRHCKIFRVISSWKEHTRAVTWVSVTCMSVASAFHVL